jgi:hypothetical protein
MMGSYKGIVLMVTTDIWIIFRRYKLCLHSIRNWLIAMVSDLGGVLNAIRGDTSDATGIDTSYPSIRMVLNIGREL